MIIFNGMDLIMLVIGVIILIICGIILVLNRLAYTVKNRQQKRNKVSK